MVSIPGIENLDWLGIIGQAVYWLGMVLMACVISGVIGFFMYITTFKIKCIELVLAGAGTNNLAVVKIRTNRFKWTDKRRQSWRPLKPMFRKIEVKPFKSEYMVGDNTVICYRYGDEFIPGQLNLSSQGEPNLPMEFKEQTSMMGRLKTKLFGGVLVQTQSPELLQIKASINPVPHEVRQWQSLMHKKHEFEFAKHDFWQDNKHIFIALGTAAFCCILTGATIYFTYKFATGGASQISSLTAAIQNIGVETIK